MNDFSDLYLVDLEVHEGESEYHQQTFVHASSLDNAQIQTKKYIENFWSETTKPDPITGLVWREDLGACASINWVTKVDSLEEIIDRVGEI